MVPSDRCRRCLDGQDSFAHRRAAVDARDGDAGEEKGEDRAARHDAVRDERPQQPCSQESVVQTLIGREDG